MTAPVRTNDLSIRAAVRAYVGLNMLATALLAFAWQYGANETAALWQTELGPRTIGLIALGVLLFAQMLGARFLLRHISSRIELLADAAESLQSGDCDLTRRLPKLSGGLGRLTQALNGFVAQLQALVIEITSRAGNIAGAASQVSQGSLDLSSRTEQQASTLEETASSMEQFTQSMRQIADGTREASKLADAAVQAAGRGGDVAIRAATQMEAAKESSAQIGSIAAVIDSLAFQTNILALNAAVEAARAGAQGRGFAVVAGEVRALAQKSAESAREVKSLIQDATTRVETGAQLANEAGAAIPQVVDAIREAARIIETIAVTTREQTASIEQVNRAISQMELATQQNAALVEETSAAADAMREQADQLNRLVGRFRVAGPTAEHVAIARPARSRQAGSSAASSKSPAPPPRLVPALAARR
ncbi:MAG: methyl-accepting chemotaxis protein [Burkholderiales bacterium]|nr:methyl-accepting chemotaxis protein [Burkholderiales bacterium]